MEVRHSFRILALLFVLAVVQCLLPHCSEAQSAAGDTASSSGWLTSTPEEQGMSSERLADLLENIQKDNHR